MGELWRIPPQIWTEAALEAIADAGVDHVDALYVGCMSGGCSWARSTWVPARGPACMGPIGHARGVRVRVGGLAFRSLLAVRRRARSLLATGVER